MRHLLLLLAHVTVVTRPEITHTERPQLLPLSLSALYSGNEKETKWMLNIKLPAAQLPNAGTKELSHNHELLLNGKSLRLSQCLARTPGGGFLAHRDGCLS